MANTLNYFFQSQNCQNNQISSPPLHFTLCCHQLTKRYFSRHEVESILKSLPISKASGPDNLSNRILHELSQEIYSPFCDLFNLSFNSGLCRSLTKKLMSVQYMKKVIDVLLPITDQYHFLIQKASFLKNLYLNIYTITYETIIYYLFFSPALYQEIPQ